MQPDDTGRMAPTKEELLTSLAKAMCDTAKALHIGQHGFMAPCSRCARLVIAVNNREDGIPGEREAQLLDEIAQLTLDRDAAQAAMRHILFCKCPDFEVCVPHGGAATLDQCSPHEHGVRVTPQPEGVSH